MKTLDGSILEGGGQILRNSVAYSSIFNKPIRIKNIRAGRADPGLKRQHLAGIQAAAKLCGAEIDGVAIGSTEISYSPKMITDEDIEIDIGSAGSCTLVLQTLLPILLYSTREITVKVIGGTDVEYSPPVDFTRFVLVPILESFGIFLDLEILKRGYNPIGGGIIKFKVKPITYHIKSVNFTDKGTLKQTVCYINGSLTENALNFIKSSFSETSNLLVLDDLKIVQTPQVKSGTISLLLVRTYEHGAILGSSELASWSMKKPENFPEVVVKRMLSKLTDKAEEENDIYVDEYLQDQLIIFMSLSHSQSRIRTGKITLHTQTAIYFAEQFTNSRFTINALSETENIIICTGSTPTTS
jgi:RNA 3'-terminal phosphate cyclase (ATP)